MHIKHRNWSRKEGFFNGFGETTYSIRENLKICAKIIKIIITEFLIFCDRKIQHTLICARTYIFPKPQKSIKC